MKPWSVVVTCEHASHDVPEGLRSRLRIPEKVLLSHRGHDRGTAVVARRLAQAAGTRALLGSVSRLVIDLNRSLGHTRLFSNYARHLSDADRRELLRKYYHPFRRKVHRRIAKEIDRGARVLHVSVHSFTPVLRGEKRTADIGFLYDPSRPAEVRAARDWRRHLRTTAPQLRAKMNYPYLGIDDGHTTALRTQFADDDYAGIELEFNQRLVRGSDDRNRRLAETLCEAFVAALG